MIIGMEDLLQRKGFHGFRLNEVLSLAQAPKGVLYYHFPKGKTELAIGAIRSAVDRTIFSLEKLQKSQQDAIQILRTWLEQAQSRLEKSDFESGCPLAIFSTTAARSRLAQSIKLVRKPFKLVGFDLPIPL